MSGDANERLSEASRSFLACFAARHAPRTAQAKALRDVLDKLISLEASGTAASPSARRLIDAAVQSALAVLPHVLHTDAPVSEQAKSFKDFHSFIALKDTLKGKRLKPANDAQSLSGDSTAKPPGILKSTDAPADSSEAAAGPSSDERLRQQSLASATVAAVASYSAPMARPNRNVTARRVAPQRRLRGKSQADGAEAIRHATLRPKRRVHPPQPVETAQSAPKRRRCAESSKQQEASSAHSEDANAAHASVEPSTSGAIPQRRTWLESQRDARSNFVALRTSPRLKLKRAGERAQRKFSDFVRTARAVGARTPQKKDLADAFLQPEETVEVRPARAVRARKPQEVKPRGISSKLGDTTVVTSAQAGSARKLQTEESGESALKPGKVADIGAARAVRARTPQRNKSPDAAFKPGEMAEVVILDGPHEGRWVSCSVTRSGARPGTYDIFVLPTKKFGNAAGASNSRIRNVSRAHLRSPAGP